MDAPVLWGRVLNKGRVGLKGSKHVAILLVSQSRLLLLAREIEGLDLGPVLLVSLGSKLLRDASSAHRVREAPS